MSDFDVWKKKIDAAGAKSERLAQARGALPAGSSRARVTTANARWMRAAEERDRIERERAHPEAEVPHVPSASDASTPGSVRLGKMVYRVQPSKLGYRLIGPRGGVVEAVRNIHSGQFALLVGTKALPWIGLDDGGVFQVKRA